MSKKGNDIIAQLLIKNMVSQNIRHHINPATKFTASSKDNNDYMIEAESAGKLSVEEKLSQEVERIQQLSYQLYMQGLRDQKMMKDLSKTLQTLKKISKDHEKAIDHLADNSNRFSAHVKKMQRHNNKLKRRVEKLSIQTKLIKQIIACISFFAGACSLSDNLSQISHTWEKAVSRECKKRKSSVHAVIDSSWKEVK